MYRGISRRINCDFIAYHWFQIAIYIYFDRYGNYGIGLVCTVYAMEVIDQSEEIYHWIGMWNWSDIFLFLCFSLVFHGYPCQIHVGATNKKGMLVR